MRRDVLIGMGIVLLVVGLCFACMGLWVHDEMALLRSEIEWVEECVQREGSARGKTGRSLLELHNKQEERVRAIARKVEGTED